MALAQVSLETPRHVKVTGHSRAFGFEPCEDVGCSVDPGGTATSCGRIACPSCGCSGTNVTTMQLVGVGSDRHRRCGCCGHAWMHGSASVYVVTNAEIAECTCPEDCECDHGNF